MASDIQDMFEQLYLTDDDEDDKEDEDLLARAFDDLKVRGSRQLWESLKWPAGPYFPDRILVSHNVHLIKRNGSKHLLSPIAEHFAKLFISSPGTLKDDPVFVDNFWTDFRAYLPRNDFTSIGDIDWSEVHQSLIDDKQQPFNVERVKAKHGFIILNEDRLPVTQYTVRPAAIMGNEQDSFRGRLFPPLRPEMVVINQSRDEAPPRLPPGEKFQAVESDKFDNWIAKWENPVTGLTEYIRVDIPDDSHESDIEEEEEEVEVFDEDEEEMSEVDTDEGEDEDDRPARGEGVGDDYYGEEDEDMLDDKWGGVGPEISRDRWKRRRQDDEEIEDVVNLAALSSEERYLPLFYLRTLPEQKEILRRAYDSEFKVVADLDKVMDKVLTDYISENIPQDDAVRFPFVNYAQQRGINGRELY